MRPKHNSPSRLALGAACARARCDRDNKMVIDELDLMPTPQGPLCRRTERLSASVALNQRKKPCTIAVATTSLGVNPYTRIRRAKNGRFVQRIES